MTIFCHNCEQAVDLPVEGPFANPLSGNLTTDATFQCLRRDCWFAKLESERGDQRVVEDLLQQYQQAEQSREERLRRLQIGNAPRNVWECQNRFWARRHELEQEREDVRTRANQDQIPEPEAKREGQKIGSESGQAQPKPQSQVQNQDHNKNQASASAAAPAQERANSDAQVAGNLREAAMAREPSPRSPRRQRRRQERRYEENPDQWEFDSDSEFDYEEVFEYPGPPIFLDLPWPYLRSRMSW